MPRQQQRDVHRRVRADAQDIFPTYATPDMTDLPDMGQQPNSVCHLQSSLWAGLTDQTGLNPAPSSTPSTAPSSVPPSSTATPKPEDVETIREGETTAKAKPAGDAVAGGDGMRWLPGYRWVVAVIALAVVGRLSSWIGFT